jgi:hypothetical protein
MPYGLRKLYKGEEYGGVIFVLKAFLLGKVKKLRLRA